MLEGHVVFLFQVMTVQGQEEESIGPWEEKIPKIWRIFGGKQKIEKIFK